MSIRAKILLVFVVLPACVSETRDYCDVAVACPSGQRCVLQAKQCVAEDYCTATVPCPDNLVCDLAVKLCRKPDASVDSTRPDSGLPDLLPDSQGDIATPKKDVGGGDSGAQHDSQPAPYAETVLVTMANLQAEHASCMESDPVGVYCAIAANRLCIQRGYQAGFGAVNYSGPTSVSIVCLRNAVVEVQVPFSDLTKHQAACTPELTVPEACRASARRYCYFDRSLTLGGGGPIEIHDQTSPPTADIFCLDQGLSTNVPWSTLTTIDPACDGVNEVSGITCVQAAQKHCRALSYEAAYGPVEWDANFTLILCLPRLRSAP